MAAALLGRLARAVDGLGHARGAGRGGGRPGRTPGRRRAGAATGARRRRACTGPPATCSMSARSEEASMTCTILPNCEPACDHGRLLRPRRHLHPGGAADPAGPGHGGPEAPRVHHGRPRGGRPRRGRPRVRAHGERHRGHRERHHRRPDLRRRPAHPAGGRHGHPPPPDGPPGHRARRHPTGCRPTPMPSPSARSSWPGPCPRPSSVAANSTADAARVLGESGAARRGRRSRPGWPPSATAWTSWPRTWRTIPTTRPASSSWPGPGSRRRPATTRRASCASSGPTTRAACTASSASSRPATST